MLLSLQAFLCKNHFLGRLFFLIKNRIDLGMLFNLLSETKKKKQAWIWHEVKMSFIPNIANSGWQFLFDLQIFLCSEKDGQKIWFIYPLNAYHETFWQGVFYANFVYLQLLLLGNKNSVYEICNGNNTISKQKRTKASIMGFSLILKQSEHLGK